MKTHYLNLSHGTRHPLTVGYPAFLKILKVLLPPRGECALGSGSDIKLNFREALSILIIESTLNKLECSKQAALNSALHILAWDRTKKYIKLHSGPQVLL